MKGSEWSVVLEEHVRAGRGHKLYVKRMDIREGIVNRVKSVEKESKDEGCNTPSTCNKKGGHNKSSRIVSAE